MAANNPPAIEKQPQSTIAMHHLSCTQSKHDRSFPEGVSAYVDSGPGVRLRDIQQTLILSAI